MKSQRAEHDMEHYQVRTGSGGIETLANELAAGVAAAMGRPWVAAQLGPALCHFLAPVLRPCENCERLEICDRALGERPWRDGATAAPLTVTDAAPQEPPPPEVTRLLLRTRNDLEDLLWRLAEVTWRTLRVLDPPVVADSELARPELRRVLRRDLGRHLYAHPLCRHDLEVAGLPGAQVPAAGE
jgi:hypothetical protein